MRSLVLAAALVALVPAHVSAAPFTFLQPGFTQGVYGFGPEFFGGVAFAPDNDVWVDFCQFSGSGLRRFDQQSTIVVNGTTVHPSSTVSSNAGCGLTNHPNGSLYTNTDGGVVRLNASTGAQTGGPFGPGGNALGITPDPQTGNLVYVGSNGTLHFVDAGLATTGVFSTVMTGNFVDGIFFDPLGNYLFCANRIPTFRLTILNRAGALVQHVPMTSEPDGIAFRATPPRFVVTNNTDGSMTRFDFPGDDFTQPPTTSVFASGGFRGDLSQVGRDGCLYVTQAGTRFDNGTVSSENSVVRICGGFNPPVSDISLAPPADTNIVFSNHTVTATVTINGSPAPGRVVTFRIISGPNAGSSGVCTVNPGCLTDANGQVSFTYFGGGGVGTDVIVASFIDDSGVVQEARASKTWIGPTSNQVSLVSAHAERDRVLLSWHAPDGMGTFDVQRRQIDTEWQRIASTFPDGGGRIEYEDLAVAAGGRYGYRLSYLEGDVESFSSEVWVDMPSASTLALMGARPNPSSRGLLTWFALSSDRPASLDLLDITGRRIVSLEVGGYGAGIHAVDLDQAGRISAGVYLIRLTQGDRVLTSRAIVAR